MAIRVISAQRAEDLLEDLVGLLAPARDDPFERDLVIVPNVGIRDWLTARLAEKLGATGHGDGIVANIEFAFPGRLSSALAGSGPQADPWQVERLTWPILRRLVSGEPQVPGFEGTRDRWAFARHLSDLFDRYSTHRPEMLLAWLQGNDTDGVPGGGELSENHRWQPALWRAVRDDLGVPSLPERNADADRPATSGLPVRVALFGIGALTPSQAGVLRTLGRDHDLLVLTLVPAPDRLGSIGGATPFELIDPDAVNAARRFDNRLLRTWGRSALEAAPLLNGLCDDNSIQAPPQPTSSPTQLERLQSAIATDASPNGHRASTDPRGDGSIQVHACHGATRQVEALRDALLHLFEADPSLTPRDVLVVCPDLGRFATLIEPVLGATLGSRSLPVVVADRSIITQSQVAAALEALVTVASSRATAADVLTLLAHPPIRRATGLGDDALVLIDRWLDQLDLRWGLDGEHRTNWDYPDGLVVGTWREMADRLLAGILVPAPVPRSLSIDLVPHDDIDGGDLLTIGRLASTIDRLTELARRLDDARPLTGWCDLLDEIRIQWLDVPLGDIRQIEELEDLTADLRTEAAHVGDIRLAGAEFRSMLLSRLRNLPGRTRLDTGAVTVASPTPLRGVPAKVIAILGCDADAFAALGTDGDDLLSINRRVGEADAAQEGRRAILDIVLAARQNLIVTCDGHDLKTNIEVPLSVPLEELLDAIADAERLTPENQRGSLPILVHHSRRLDHPRNLGVGDEGVRLLHPDGPWTFDPTALNVYEAMDAATKYGPDPETLEPAEITTLDLDDLGAAIDRPARALLRDRLGVRLPSSRNLPNPDLDLWPDNFDIALLGNDAINALRNGQSLDEWRTTRPLRGGLPPARLGDAALESVAREVQSMAAEAGLTLADFETLHLDNTMNGFTIHSAVPVYGDTVLELRYVRPHPHRRLIPWLRLAALTLHDADRDWVARLVLRGDKKDSPPTATEFSIRGDTAAERRQHATRALETLHDLRQRALRAPVPFFRRLSWTYLGTEGGKPEDDLENDLKDPWTAWCIGATTLEDLQEEPPTALEHGLPDHSSRAGRYALALTTCWNETTVPIGSGA
jgi:exodeoxyribonuclease V gamma subunit